MYSLVYKQMFTKKNLLSTLLINQTCINEKLLPKCTHIHKLMSDENKQIETKIVKLFMNLNIMNYLFNYL